LGVVSPCPRHARFDVNVRGLVSSDTTTTYSRVRASGAATYTSTAAAFMFLLRWRGVCSRGLHRISHINLDIATRCAHLDDIFSSRICRPIRSRSRIARRIRCVWPVCSASRCRFSRVNAQNAAPTERPVVAQQTVAATDFVLKRFAGASRALALIPTGQRDIYV
jgi:hypothetical protein